MNARYTIDGGLAGKERLDVLAGVCAAGTSRLFDAVGVEAGARCVDVGCGGGHVSQELAQRASTRGSVLGIDLDDTVLELARADLPPDGAANVEFQRGDATQLNLSSFDVAYARCLLSHVADPAGVVAAVAAAVRPGGVVIVEDIDFGGYFCYPACRAHDNYMKWYRETVRRRGGNADLGSMLPELLGDAGTENVSASVSQECDVSGDTKLIPPITLERIADAVVSEGVATEEDIADALDDLFARSADTTTLMGMPRIVQAWGKTPERAI